MCVYVWCGGGGGSRPKSQHVAKCTRIYYYYYHYCCVAYCGFVSFLFLFFFFYSSRMYVLYLIRFKVIEFMLVCSCFLKLLHYSFFPFSQCFLPIKPSIIFIIYKTFALEFLQSCPKKLIHTRKSAHQITILCMYIIKNLTVGKIPAGHRLLNHCHELSTVWLIMNRINLEKRVILLLLLLLLTLST